MWAGGAGSGKGKALFAKEVLNSGVRENGSVDNRMRHGV